MKSTPRPHSLFAVLRRSGYLQILLLLVLIGKIGPVKACAGEEMAGSESGSPSAWVLALDGEGDAGLNDPLEPSSPTEDFLAGDCCHCSCHQTGAISGAALGLEGAEGPTDLELPLPAPRQSRLARELRPPIL